MSCRLSRRWIVVSAISFVTTWVRAAQPEIVNIRFGIVRELSEGVFEFVQETNRIPRRLKATGFRFGIGFENPKREPIEWYELVHLPEALREVSGNMQRTRDKVLRTRTLKSNQPTVIDDFWSMKATRSVRIGWSCTSTACCATRQISR